MCVNFFRLALSFKYIKNVGASGKPSPEVMEDIVTEHRDGPDDNKHASAVGMAAGQRGGATFPSWSIKQSFLEETPCIKSAT
jgi:hypothetical protein